MASPTFDRHTVTDAVAGYTGAGSTHVPTCPPLIRHHPLSTDFSFTAMPEFEPIALEQHLKKYEEQARNKYFTALGNMRNVRLSPWLVRLLEKKIVPALERIGFDATLAWTLFKMAAPAWESMGPMTAENLWFHPVLIKDMKKIRNGVLARSRRQSESETQLSGMDPQDRLGWIKLKMDPQELLSLFENIAPSWIILPRAYAQLEKKHAYYFPGYLDYLTKEIHSEFAQILARLVIEFAGNYAMKFISEFYPRKPMIKAVFYGYATLFWKNLRRPPCGFEDALVYANFLRWAELCHRRIQASDEEMALMIGKMKTNQKKVFPSVNAFDLARGGDDDWSRFLITLRHGCPGIDAVTHYFSIDSGLLKNGTNGRLRYTEVPAALNKLFQSIRKNYALETPGVQKFIRLFLSKLSQNYTTGRFRSDSTAGAGSRQLRFLRPRVTDMIRDLTQSIQ